METQHAQKLLKNGQKKNILEPNLWLISVGDFPCEINIRLGGENKLVSLIPGWKGLLAMRRLSLKIEKGYLFFHEIDLMIMTKLQSFIDKSMNRKEEKNVSQCDFSLIKTDEISILTSRRELEYWLLRQTLNPQPGMEGFVDLLRSTEWYWLVYFLLDEFTGSNKLQDLGQRYGLSTSHFRRLCRQALGNTTKVALRDWRMGKAVLALIDENQNLTEIAFEHGYSSLSHFSNEFKETL